MPRDDSNPKPQRRSRRPIDVHVGGRVRERRRQLGVSRAALATMLDLSIQQIQKYESGDSTIAASRLHHIGAALGVPVSYFFDEMPPDLEAASLPKAEQPLDTRASSREIRQMMQVYRGIVAPDVRHKIYELARSLSGRWVEDGGSE